MSKLRALFITDPLIVILTLVFASISLAASIYDPSKLRQAAVARSWARALLWISGVKVKVEGLEKISPTGSYVFVSNHLSYMDTPVVLANIPLQFRFLAKRGLFQIPFLGWHLVRAGHIPVPREDPRAAVKTMNVAAQVIRDAGISVLIFPEGGRSREGSLGVFKEGAAFIGVRAGVPLVPMCLKGTREILPFGSGAVCSGTVIMRIGDPISTRGSSDRDRAPLTAELRKRIVVLLEEDSVTV